MALAEEVTGGFQRGTVEFILAACKIKALPLLFVRKQNTFYCTKPVDVQFTTTVLIKHLIKDEKLQRHVTQVFNFNVTEAIKRPSYWGTFTHVKSELCRS